VPEDPPGRALVYVNTLMVQDVLVGQTWADRLFWAHVAPYGEVRLDMGRRLPPHGAAPVASGETR
jgi:hypothetical protein